MMKFNHNFARITIDSYNSLPIKKMLTFDNVIILIKSVELIYNTQYF